MPGLLDYAKMVQQLQGGLLGNVGMKDQPGSVYRDAVNSGMALAQPLSPSLIPGMAAPTAPGLRDIRPPKENLNTVVNSNFKYGSVVGPQTAKIGTLKGGMSVGDKMSRVEKLAGQISSPTGYFERIIVDGRGNVIEGQHRLAALRKLGIQEVPIMRVRDNSQGYNADKMEAAINSVGKIHPDQTSMIMRHAFDMLKAERGNVKAVLSGYEFPPQFKAHFEAALKAAK
jgi:hypothetical protein